MLFARKAIQMPPNVAVFLYRPTPLSIVSVFPSVSRGIRSIRNICVNQSSYNLGGMWQLGSISPTYKWWKGWKNMSFWKRKVVGCWIKHCIEDMRRKKSKKINHINISLIGEAWILLIRQRKYKLCGDFFCVKSSLRSSLSCVFSICETPLLTTIPLLVFLFEDPPPPKNTFMRTPKSIYFCMQNLLLTFSGSFLCFFMLKAEVRIKKVNERKCWLLLHLQ